MQEKTKKHRKTSHSFKHTQNFGNIIKYSQRRKASRNKSNLPPLNLPFLKDLFPTASDAQGSPNNSNDLTQEELMGVYFSFLLSHAQTHKHIKLECKHTHTHTHT